MLDLMTSLITAYVATSMWETLVHWKILHASRRRRQQWKRLGGVFNLLRKAYFSHAVIHHRKTYKTNYYVQFDSTEDKNALDARLKPRPQLRILGNRYGLDVSGFWETAVFIAVPVVISTSLFLLLCPDFVCLGVLIALSPLLLSKYLHPLLHAEATGPLEPHTFLSRLRLRRSRFFIYIRRYHYLHHEDVSCNYNLLPGGDWLLGVHKPAGKERRVGSGHY